jgi:copper chaperone CopZ
MRVKTVSTLLVAVAAIGFATPALAQDKPAVAKAAPAAAPGAVVKVNGLICDFCVQALNKTFRKQAAVKDISVDLDAKEIRLAFKPGATLDDATIGRLVRDAGYNVVSIARRVA